MNTQFWQPITPVKGEPIPDDAQFSRGGQLWFSPDTERYPDFCDSDLGINWRVPREVVPLDVAVDAIMHNSFEVNGETYWMVEIDGKQAYRAATREALRELVTAKLREMSEEEPICNNCGFAQSQHAGSCQKCSYTRASADYFEPAPALKAAKEAMQLTAEERDALERLRSMHFYDGSLIEIPTKRYDDLMTVLGMSERLLPVRTYGNLVIRWDDPVTPERLQACGFVYVEREDSGNKCYQYHAMVKGIHSTYINVRAFSRFTGSSEITIVQGSFRYEIDGQYVSIPHEYQPRNMLEVWQLMERCGIDNKESFQ